MVTIHTPQRHERLRMANAFIANARRDNAWPVKVGLESGRTETGLPFPGSAVVADYQDGSRKAHGVVGPRYCPAGTDAWEDTVRAACLAGATPVANSIMEGGASTFAGFKVDDGGGFRQFFHLLDDLSGTRALRYMGTSFRVICRNQQAQYLPNSSAIRHTSSIEQRMEVLRANMEDVIEHGKDVRELYARTKATPIDEDEAYSLLQVLFPVKKDASTRSRENARNAQNEALRCALNPVNRDGANLATLWNGLTYAIDRLPNGQDRVIRQTKDYTKTKTELHLLGSRGAAVRRFQKAMESIVSVGSVSGYIEQVAA